MAGINMLFHFFLLAIGVALWFIYDKKKHKHYPPGPPRMPLVGNILQLSKLSWYPAEAYQKLAKVYGDIVYLRFGSRDVITFNSYETVRDILAHEHAAERTQNMLPFIWERMLHKNIGINFSNGNVWQTLRRYTVRTLRDFGFGKAASMDVVISEEAEELIEYVKDLSEKSPNGIPFSNRIFDLSTINILWRLVTGVKYKLNDSNILYVLKLNHDILKSTNFAVDIGISFPVLYHIFPNWFGKNEQILGLNKLRDYFMEIVENRRSLGDYQTSPSCYVDEFLSKIDANRNNPDTEFTDEQLVMCLLDLFQAGSDTTANTLSFSMLYMLLHQDIQEKVQAEIDANVPKGESLSLATRNILPYTHATILETLRFSTVLPTPPARQASEDFYFNGYFIKKGIILAANQYAVHFSTDIWGDPYNFRPERFLTKEGDVDADVANKLLPFGHGARKCLAFTLAENNLFIFFTSILRKFKVLKVPGENDPSIVPDLGVTVYPKPYKVRFVIRE